MKLLVNILLLLFSSITFSQSTDTLNTLLSDIQDELNQNEPAGDETTEIEFSEATLKAREIIKKAYRFKVEQLSRLKSYDLHIFSASSIKYHLIDDVDQLFSDYKGDKYTFLGISETEQYDYYRRHSGEKYYDKKIIIKSKRQTELFNKLYAFPYSINMYDDEIYLINETVPGPLAEDCLDMYSYKLTDIDSSSGKKVYEISIKEQTPYKEGFRGILHIEDSTFALLDVNLKTNFAVNIPLVKDIHIVEEFTTYTDSLNNKYNLPKSFSLSVNAAFVGVVKLKMRTLSEVRDVMLNQKQPGVKYDDFNIVIKPDAGNKSQDYWQENGLIETDTAASSEIKKIYQKRLESKSFVTYTGTGFRFGNNLTWNFLYSYTFNRIEGNHLELNLTYERNYGRYIVNPGIVYGTADKKTKYFLNFSALPTKNLDLRFSGEAHSNLVTMFKKFGWLNYIENAISTLFTKKDRVDYYFGKGFTIGADYRINDQITVGAEFLQEKQESDSNNTNYSFYRKNKDYATNPKINDGMSRKMSVSIIFDFNRYRMIDWGDGDVSRSRMTVLPVLEFKYGYSGRKFTQSDFEFKDYMVRVTGFVKLHTWIKILYKFGAYLKYGRVPYQELKQLDPKFIGFPNDITFIVPNYREFLGDRVIFFNFENEFGKIFPYDIPILSNITLLGDINFGKTWITDSNRDFSPNDIKVTDGTYVEVGFGLTRILELGTLRYGWRLNNFNKGYDSFLMFDIGLRI